MYVVRDVFRCRPGKARELVGKFKAAAPHLQDIGIANVRILTDKAARFWTVVLEGEIESFDGFVGALEQRATSPELQQAMSGYMDLVTGGHRELLKIE